MTLKHRLPYLFLLLVFLSSVPFLSSRAWPASADSPKKGQMVITTKTPKYGSWPIEITASLFVETAPGILYRILTDYESMPRFVPHLKKCVITKRKKNRVYIEQTFKHFPLTMYLNMQVKEEPPNKIVFKRYAGNMKTYEGHWQLEQVGPKSTIFTLKVKAEPDFPVPQKVMIWILESELPKGLLEMRKRALRITGQPEPNYSIEIVSR